MKITLEFPDDLIVLKLGMLFVKDNKSKLENTGLFHEELFDGASYTVDKYGAVRRLEDGK